MKSILILYYSTEKIIVTKKKKNIIVKKFKLNKLFYLTWELFFIFVV